MSSYNEINDIRRRQWLYYATKFYLSRMPFSKARDYNLWVFSAWEGNKYADNSKYLYEYMLGHQKHINCIWQTKNKAVYDEMKKSGLPVQLLGSQESKKTLQLAGVAVYTNGIDDFGYSTDVFGATLVCLWHGAGFKKGYRLQLDENKTLRRRLSDCKFKLFSWVKRDITVTTSQYEADLFRRTFLLSKQAPICISGQARNDALMHHYSIQEVFTNEKFIQKFVGKKLILFMPTYREHNEPFINNIRNIFASKLLENLLCENDAMLLVKLHYLNVGKINDNSACCLLNDSDVKDVQKLTAIADISISDYSSSVTDYALLKRPIIFYIPDWDEYGADKLMMPETKEVCKINCAHNLNELIDTISITLSNPSCGIAQANKINELIDDTDVEVGGFAEANFKSIIRELNHANKIRKTFKEST